MEISVNVGGAESIDLNTVLGQRPERVFLGHGDYDVRDQPFTLGDLVAERLVEKLSHDESYPTLREMVQRVRADILREKLEPIVEEAIQGQLQLTNEFGEPRGPKVTLRQYIVDEAKKILTKARRSARGNHETLLEEIVNGKVKAALVNELKDALDTEKKKVQELLAKEGGRIIAEALGEVAQEALAARKRG